MNLTIEIKSKKITRKKPFYVLITPVKDEESLITETIFSVISQDHLPLQWVIVSDGSTDRTEEIVKAVSESNSWIRLVCLPPRIGRCFASVVRATEEGVRALTEKEYQYIGLLDADVRFGSDYFKKLIERFEANPKLGLAGGMVVDFGLSKNKFPRNLQDVPGAVQFFRRKCFDGIGGLYAIPEGGWDTLTCVRARMIGYETKLFTDLVIDHLKPRNISEGSLICRTWQLGVRDYALGFHPIFEIFKCIGRLMESPPVIGAVARLSGYYWASISRRKRIIPSRLVHFTQNEQLKRVKQVLGIIQKNLK